MPAQVKIKPSIIKINLLPQDQFTGSFLGKLLSWSLSVGRYIIIFTELIVILTFLSRFKLDRELTDLNEAIAKEKTIIQSYSETEAKFLDLQAKANFLASKQDNLTTMPTLTMLEKTLPIDVKVEQLSILPKSWSIKAHALSAAGMKQAVDQIIVQSPRSDVSISAVKLNSKTGMIEFEIRVTAQIKQAAKPKAASKTPAKNTSIEEEL